MLNTKGIVILLILLLTSSGSYAITAKEYIERAQSYIQEDEHRAAIIG